MLNRKHQLLTLAIVLLVAASCFVEQANARKHRGSSKKGHHHRRPKGVNFEIYHPKGVMVWYPYRPGMELFGIEIFINQAQHARQEGADSSEESTMSCDICLNTTEVSYGKFILRSDDAIIRSRDHVHYNAIVRKATGEAYISRSNDFYVSESRILIGDINGDASRACNESSAVAKSSPSPAASEPGLLQEVKLLEEILSELNQQCHATQNQTRQLLLSAQTPSHYAAKELYQFVANALASKLPTISWNRALVDAFYASNNGIIFEVATIVDKLKILKLAKALPGQPIQDVDALPAEDMTNDIESWVME